MSECHEADPKDTAPDGAPPESEPSERGYATDIYIEPPDRGGPYGAHRGLALGGERPVSAAGSGESAESASGAVQLDLRVHLGRQAYLRLRAYLSLRGVWRARSGPAESAEAWQWPLTPRYVLSTTPIVVVAVVHCVETWGATGWAAVVSGAVLVAAGGLGRAR